MKNNIIFSSGDFAPNGTEEIPEFDKKRVKTLISRLPCELEFEVGCGLSGVQPDLILKKCTPPYFDTDETFVLYPIGYPRVEVKIPCCKDEKKVFRFKSRNFYHQGVYHNLYLKEKGKKYLFMIR